MARRAGTGPDDEFDEGPSDADVEAFGDVTTTCRECGAELYDDVAICWKCGHAVSSEERRGTGAKTWVVVVAVLLTGLMLWGIFGRWMF
ncbi:MAG: hypothetical protein SFY69_02110 [Planctomycetota bacterium]|nr:hypothetical protein [Planctomycetota bacterium]